jgi:hypothetical protein
VTVDPAVEVAAAKVTDLTVAIYDDDENEANGLRTELKDVGVEGVVVPPEHTDLDAAVATLVGAGDAAICDHLLSIHGAPRFTGAELVVRLVQDRVPSVLLTGFLEDVGITIRPHLPNIPAFVRRSDLLRPEVVLSELQACRLELEEGQRPEHRQSLRTPVYIERVTHINEDAYFDARIAGWPNDEAIRFPASMLGERWRQEPTAAVDQVFFAAVNLAARRPEELFLEDVEEDPAEIDNELFFGAE